MQQLSDVRQQLQVTCVISLIVSPLIQGAEDMLQVLSSATHGRWDETSSAGLKLPWKRDCGERDSCHFINAITPLQNYLHQVQDHQLYKSFNCLKPNERHSCVGGKKKKIFCWTCCTVSNSDINTVKYFREKKLPINIQHLTTPHALTIFLPCIIF